MLELKLQPPVSRPAQVVRRALLDDLKQQHGYRVVCVCAPAGYGKSTLMAQWMQELEGSSGWMTCDESDNDPSALFEHLVMLFESSGLLVSRLDEQPRVSSEVLTHHLTDLLSAARGEGFIFLDQVEQITSRDSRDVINSLLMRLPDGVRVVLSSRSVEGLSMPLLRSRGEVLEVGIAELAMDTTEAKQLFESMEVDVPDVSMAVRRTEGWPAGLYLSGLASQASGSAAEVLDVGGDDRYVSDFIRDEVLSQFSEDEARDAVKASILERMSGPLLDHVLERSGSAADLARFEAANLLLIPLDRTRQWYRYHSLLLDHLRAELGRAVPADEIRAMHRRAAEWLFDNGKPEAAIDHSIAADDQDVVAAMVAAAAQPVYTKGRVDTVTSWLAWLEEKAAYGENPGLAAVGSFVFALEGDAVAADRLARYAYIEESTGLGPHQLMVRALRMEHGPEAALEDSEQALSISGPDDRLLPTIWGAEALARLSLGDWAAAEESLAQGEAAAGRVQGWPFQVFASGQLAWLALRRDDWDRAEQLSEGAIGTIAQRGLETFITSALALIVAARIATHRGQIEEARTLAARAASIRPNLTTALPSVAVQVMTEMIRSYVELADVAGARRVARQAGDVASKRPNLGVLIDELDEQRQRLSSLPAGDVGPSSLTTAELRLMPFLVTHLTYPEIGERLYVSRHTVKTQAMSIYRKLGVSSRGEAVSRAREVGLLSG